MGKCFLFWYSMCEYRSVFYGCKKNKLETVPNKMRLADKDVNSKKYTILIQTAWDSGNVTYSWASHFDKVA